MKRERLKALLAEYGRVALLTYFTIFALSIASFALAIQLGFEIDSAYGSAGLLAAAYLATKAIQPLRIGATLLLTPAVARLLQKLRGKATESETPRAEAATAEAETAAPEDSAAILSEATQPAEGSQTS